MFLFPIAANKKPYFQHNSTSGFYQFLCYNQAITMIYGGHMIDKMVAFYKKSLQ